jgi:hypothetical protein
MAKKIRVALQAVILIGGDKAGNWSGWYRVAVPLAEQAYEDHVNLTLNRTPLMATAPA